MQVLARLMLMCRHAIIWPMAQTNHPCCLPHALPKCALPLPCLACTSPTGQTSCSLWDAAPADSSSAIAAAAVHPAAAASLTYAAATSHAGNGAPPPEPP